MPETAIRADSYNRLLVRIFIATAVSSKALFEAGMSESNTYYLINKAIKNRHIKDMTYREYHVDRFRPYHYYTITAKGIKYLSTQTTYPWLRYLPGDLSTVNIFPVSRKASQIAFATRCGDALIFALNAGAGVSDYIFSGETAGVSGDTELGSECPSDLVLSDDNVVGRPDGGNDDPNKPDSDDDSIANNASYKYNSKTLGEIKQNVLQNVRANADEEMITGGGDTRFYPVREMKLLLYDNNRDADSRPDFRYGKYTGVFVTPIMSLLLYHDEHDGFKWIPQMSEQDLGTLCAFSRYCTVYKNAVQGNLRAGILVANAASFASIITDKHKKRKPNTVIGKTFNSVYLLPLSPNGAALLNWISTNSQSAKEAYADLAVSKKLDARPNTDGRRIAFRLVSSAGYLFDGYEMDYRLILHAINLKQENPNLTFKVICFAWQEEFYRKLWPDVGTVTID